MKILVDCDVLLDVGLKRVPFFEDSARILRWAELHPGNSGLAWHTLSNLAYLLEGDPRAFLLDLLVFMRVAYVGQDQAEKALRLPVKDLEDAMQAVSAEEFGASYIITRNVRDYRHSPIPAASTEAFLRTIGAR